MSERTLPNPDATFLSFPLRSSLTACLVGASIGLLAGFASIMLLFLGRTGGAVSDLLQMQILGLALLAIPWACYRLHWHQTRPHARLYWSLIPMWLTASLIVTLGTAISGLIALVVATGVTEQTFGLADYLPALSITAYSALWVDCFVGRRKIPAPGTTSDN